MSGVLPVEGAVLPLAAPRANLEIGAESIGLRPDESIEPSGFSNVLEGALLSANDSIRSAEALAESFATGERDDIHGTMVALSQADIELRFVGNVRNKVVDAFYELWRMQI